MTCFSPVAPMPHGDRRAVRLRARPGACPQPCSPIAASRQTADPTRLRRPGPARPRAASTSTYASPSSTESTRSRSRLRRWKDCTSGPKVRSRRPGGPASDGGTADRKEDRSRDHFDTKVSTAAASNGRGASTSASPKYLIARSRRGAGAARTDGARHLLRDSSTHTRGSVRARPPATLCRHRRLSCRRLEHQEGHLSGGHGAHARRAGARHDRAANAAPSSSSLGARLEIVQHRDRRRQRTASTSVRRRHY